MKLRPLHDRILARRIAATETTAGGLFIPDTAQDKPLEAVVALQNAASVAGLMLTTEALSAERPKDNGVPDPGMRHGHV